MSEDLPRVDALDLGFDEDWYVSNYPDVADAIEAGVVASGRAHFEKYGGLEGRMPLPFDQEFYLSVYPLVADELRAGLAKSPIEHFFRIGRFRGYIAHRAARRPHNAHPCLSPFGGLWTDLPHADDLITGREETGQITGEEAEMLRFWRKNGYLILKGGVSAEVTAKARQTLDNAYSGGFPDLKFECHSVAKSNIPWQPEINGFPAKALDIHMFSRAIRDAMFAPKITRMLGILFDCHPLASQTLAFLRGSAQPAHQDSAYVAYTVPREFAATWIALEDVSPQAGELFYYPGSNSFEEFVYGDGYKSVAEAIRAGANPEEMNARVYEHEATLPPRANQMGLEKQIFLPKAGDVLIWHSDLAHGGMPVSKEITRKSLVTHYCPRFNVPLFFEHGSTRHLFRHNDGYFTSGVYPFAAPR